MKLAKKLVRVYISNFIENKQAKIISFINNIKKTDYKQIVLKLKTRNLVEIQNIA